MRFRLPRTSLGCVVLAFLAVAVACQEPTQVTVRITSSERCENLSDVQTIVGPNPDETQSRFKSEVSTGVSDRCDPDGFIGTLVITPGGGKGSVLVAAGVRGGDGMPPPPATKCFDTEVAKRCIVARRTFSFIENKALVLPINLDPLCIGQSCDPASTCFKGRCVSAEVVCVGEECGLAEENPGGGTGEGGATEAGSGDGAYDADLDGAGGEDVFDAGTSVDAMADARADADGGPVSDGSVTLSPCSMTGMSWNCTSPANGIVTPGTCADGTNAVTYSCCRCTCPSTSQASGCQMSAAGVTCPVGCP